MGMGGIGLIAGQGLGVQYPDAYVLHVHTDLVSTWI